jgi:putative spermidine/putrescine transport system permease protein
MANRNSLVILGAPVFVWVFALVVIPCVILLIRSVMPEDGNGKITFETYSYLANSRVAQQALLRSITVAFWVTALTVIAGYPIALSVARMGSRMRSIVMAIVIFPFLLSAVVRAFGWGVILGEKGVLNDFLINTGIIVEPLRLLHNTFAIIVGETHILLPYMILSLLAVIKRIEPNLKDAAMSLGAPPPVVFFKVIIPMTLPGLMTGMLLVFSLAMTAFATPFLLGGSRSPILSVLLYKYAFTLFDWSKAAAVGGVLLIMGVVFVAAHKWLSRVTLRGSSEDLS